ncbi:hypothetical protein BGZ58_010022 [Dissophora ornata]|nr:hypothetical protein BGZ58_010022 [Dissophora ornata]
MANHGIPVYESSVTAEDQRAALGKQLFGFSAGSNSELAPEQSRQQISSECHLNPLGMNTQALTPLSTSFEVTLATLLESSHSAMDNDTNDFMAISTKSTLHALSNATATNLNLTDVAAACSFTVLTYPHLEAPIVKSNSPYVVRTYEESCYMGYNYGIPSGVTHDAQYLHSMIPTVGEPERGGPVTPPRENGYNFQPVEIPPSINGSPTKSPEDQIRNLPKNPPPTAANRDTKHSSPSEYPGGVFFDQPYDHFKAKSDGRKHNEQHKLKRAKADAGSSMK